MVKLEKGGQYRAELVRSGVSQRGDWELIRVSDGKKKSITVWPDNKPSGVVEGGDFVIEEITTVKLGARKDSQGRWFDDVSIEGIVRPAKSVSMDYDTNLPFTIDDSPFDDDNPFAPGGSLYVPEDEQLPL